MPPRKKIQEKPAAGAGDSDEGAALNGAEEMWSQKEVQSAIVALQTGMDALSVALMGIRDQMTDGASDEARSEGSRRSAAGPHRWQQ